MDVKTVLYEVRGPLALLTLNRPDKLNAINAAMIAELHQAMDRAEADDQVRLVVLRGSGRAFSAGFDLEEEYPQDADDPLAEEIQRDFDMIMRFWDCAKPTLASVHGACLGGAFEMLLACDLAVATEDARLGVPEVKFGSALVTQLLQWVCGPRRATELLLSGEDRLSAEQALDWGILNRVARTDQLGKETLDLALKIARNDARAVRIGKAAIKEGYDMAGLRDALRTGMNACIEVEREPSQEAARFYDIVKNQGTASAVQWLDEKLKVEELQTKEIQGTDHE